MSASPFAPESPDARSLPNSLAAAIKDSTAEGSNALVLEAYLRGTAWNTESYARLKALDADMAECRGGQNPVMVVQSMVPLTMRILPRGNWQDERGEVVLPAVPVFLSYAEIAASRRLTRMDLADWILSPDNPLTARVFVNRLWKQFLGTGLCDSVEDVGAQGEWPSNPELLDWLAVEFREGRSNGVMEYGSIGNSTTSPLDHSTTRWNVKRMVKLIVMSATYRQSSRARPEL
jgi:hypothetical protein